MSGQVVGMSCGSMGKAVELGNLGSVSTPES